MAKALTKISALAHKSRPSGAMLHVNGFLIVNKNKKSVEGEEIELGERAAKFVALKKIYKWG